jgi:two-component system response regulator WspF
MRIGIVNDLRLAVESLKRAVATLPGATVAWVAEDGAQAVSMCARDRPDVVLMDMIMPVMDGVEATRRIMQATPCPILVVTATVEGNAGKVFEALGAGALDAVATPGIGADGRAMNAEPLVAKIRAIGVIAGVGRTPVQQPPTPAPQTTGAGGIAPFVAIGVSTGGPQALAAVLPSLTGPIPVVIVQHIDPTFAPGLAAWLSKE